MKAHGVGFRLPSDPFDKLIRRELTGAVNIAVAKTTPRLGQTYSKKKR